MYTSIEQWASKHQWALTKEKRTSFSTDVPCAKQTSAWEEVYLEVESITVEAFLSQQ